MEKLSNRQLVYNNTFKSTKNEPINERILIPYYSLYSDRIVIHPKPFNNIVRKKIRDTSLKNLKKPKFRGNLSKTQKATIKKKLTAWLTSIQLHNLNQNNQFEKREYYPVFITITLSAKQQHSDNEIKRKFLDLFIKNLKNKFGVNKYFWRAESQQNGNIHFHIIVDKYCNYMDLKLIWNKVQNKLGYINEFEKKIGHRNPNSVDVKSVKQVDNFVNYLLKYCLKDEKARKIEGRVFGMSDELRSLGIYQDVLDTELSDYLTRYMKYDYFTVYKSDYYTVLLFSKTFYQSSFYALLQKYSRNYYEKMYQNLYVKKLKEPKVIKKFKEPLIKQETQLQLFKLSDQIKIINHYNCLNQKAFSK